MEMVRELPANIIETLKTLKSNGFEGYIVGGGVRDILLNKIPNDYDITTNALPEQVIEIFPKTIDIGTKHGTIGVIWGKNDCPNGHPGNFPTADLATNPSDGLQKNYIEITTYRIDGEYINNRRPERVTFTPNLADDLRRRDFTINAMAWDGYGKIIDLFGGIKDLKNGIICCVGEANLRFSEDALRMLRAIRFAAQLGFIIESETYNAICNNAELIKNVSAERIRIEFDKILLSDNPKFLKVITDAGLGRFIFPELNINKFDIENLKTLPKQLDLRLAALGEPILGLLDTLKYDNETKHSVALLVKYRNLQIKPTKTAVKQLLREIGEKNFLNLTELQNAVNLREIHFEIKQNCEAFTISQLAINGHDLMKLGIKGKTIGEILQKLLDIVLENPDLNNTQTLIGLVGEIRGGS